MVNKFLLYSLLIVSLTHNVGAIANVKSVIEDSSITSAVKAKLMKENLASASNVKVETNHGVVSLQAVVESNAEAHKIIEIAASTEGVQDVDVSHLVITKSTHPVSDAVITSKVNGMFIKEKLFGDNPIATCGIQVETKEGVVYLSGKVKNKAQANTATQLAKSVRGVKEVKSTLKITA